MDKTTKTVRTFYLYVVSLLSLIFLAVGIGNLVNTTLKVAFFKEAEKRDYNVCINYPYYTSSVDLIKIKEVPDVSDLQKEQIDNMIEDYEKWKKENTGDVCYKSEREKRLVNSLSMILISLPLYIFHWAIIRKEKKENEN